MCARMSQSLLLKPVKHAILDRIYINDVWRGQRHRVLNDVNGSRDVAASVAGSWGWGSFYGGIAGFALREYRLI